MPIMTHQGTPTPEFLARLETRRDALRAQARGFLEQRKAAGVEELSGHDETRFRVMTQDINDMTEQCEHYRSELARVGTLPGGLGSSQGAMAYGRMWAQQVAERLTRTMGRGGETRAVVSGSIDIPALVETEIIPIARPTRLIDLFPNRMALEGNTFEYFVQTVRTNAATAVPDGQLKPTSTLTVAPHEDRCRVIAHLSEPTPIRLWDDHSELQSWLASEMINGVLDGLEAQIIAGDGTGEDMLGLLATPGTTAVPFDTDVATTLRSALTALQVIGEVPNGWALHPEDAQAIDLVRAAPADGPFLSEGYQTGVAPGQNPSSNNIFGPDVRRVISTSVPQGTAILGDFSKLRVYVRQDANLAIDASGELFTKNLFIARGEGRFGIGVLRPSAFAIADLTATTRSCKSKRT